MGVFQNNLMGAAAAAASASTDFYDYQITNSCRFNGTDQALERSFTSAPSDADKKAISVWIKRSGSTGTDSEFGSTTNTKICSANNFQQLEFNTNNPTGYSDSFGYTLPGAAGAAWTARRFRDPSAWLHLVWIYNSDESTATDRIKVYFNGEQTPLSTDTDYWDINTAAQPDSGTDCGFGLNSTEMHIARYQYNDAGWFGGQMADFIMIDGAASISDFGETKNGVWIPKDPSELTFGTNGFWLDFKSASDPGNDASGNNNDFTNIGSIATHDILTDSPTFNSDSNGGNFATLNPLVAVSGVTFTESNLKEVDDNSGWQSAWSTMAAKSGKFYFEAEYTTSARDRGYIGVAQAKDLAANQDSYYAGQTNNSAGWYSANGSVYINASTTGTTLNTYTTGDILGCAIDIDNGYVYFSKNGTWEDSGDPASGASGTGGFSLSGSTTGDPWHLIVSNWGAQFIVNYGQEGTFAGSVTAGGNSDTNGYGNFKYSVPSGYSALCTGALPIADEIDPAETNDNYPQKLFSPIIWTGDGNTSRAITGLGFQLDWIWFKARNSAFSNRLYDTTRGITSTGGKRLFSNTNGAETNQTSGQDISAVGSDGFTTGASSANYTNDTNNDAGHVAWCWRANGGTTSSGSGDLTSTHQVDPSGGFSIVKAVGDGGSGDKTVTHGMSAAPDCILAKDLDATRNWDTYWSSGLTSGYGLRLNTNDNQLSGRWGTVNSSIFTCKDSYTWGGTDNYIYYCFRNIEGYIKVGTYTGNADDDGSFVYTGFKPAWMLLREVAVDNWGIYDNKRDGQNNDDGYGNAVLYADEAYDEENQASRAIDILSNGFKLRTSNATFNASGGTYVFLAMAHNPFKYATAR